MSGWLTIDTAPKDGREIDVWAAYGDGSGKRITDVSWDKDWLPGDFDGEPQYGWSDPNGGVDGCSALIDPEVMTVTHWMPKPSPPTVKRG